MDKEWWKEAVVYQIYPRSFMDSNGDGIGDLRGITSKLDYLEHLGIGVLWLSPVYESPNVDNGYDIADYRSIMKEFGTIEDLDELLQGLHRRGMKLIMDLVVNHTSDQHAWFVQSRSAKDSPYRDYYYWVPGQQAQEPNNWESYFGGSAWQYDETTSEYYLHLFSEKQPDLNWNNPSVRNEIYEMMTWWLDRGIDGFRMDVINAIAKASGLPDAPNPEGKAHVWAGQYFLNQPKVHEYIQEMHDRVLAKYDIMTVGETGNVTPEDALLFAGYDRRELNMIFQFEHVDLDGELGDRWNIKPWSLSSFKRVMSKWQTELYGKAWGSLFLNNHDQPRSVSRFGNDQEYRVQSAKMLATLIHLQQGTPFVYQGEEIGMTNVQFESIDDYRDVEIHNLWNQAVVNGGADSTKVLQAIHYKGRDNARTPFQWNDQPNAGFTTGTPWIKVNPNCSEINAETALSDPDSVFHYYRQLIALRKQYSIVVHGRYDLILEDHREIYAYTRALHDQHWVIVCNFSDKTPVFELPDTVEGKVGHLIISNYPNQPCSDRSFELRPFEARVFSLK